MSSKLRIRTYAEVASGSDDSEYSETESVQAAEEVPKKVFKKTFKKTSKASSKEAPEEVIVVTSKESPKKVPKKFSKKTSEEEIKKLTEAALVESAKKLSEKASEEEDINDSSNLSESEPNAVMEQQTEQASRVQDRSGLLPIQILEDLIKQMEECAKQKELSLTMAKIDGVTYVNPVDMIMLLKGVTRKSALNEWSGWSGRKKLGTLISHPNWSAPGHKPSLLSPEQCTTFLRSMKNSEIAQEFQAMYDKIVTGFQQGDLTLVPQIEAINVAHRSGKTKGTPMEMFDNGVAEESHKQLKEQKTAAIVDPEQLAKIVELQKQQAATQDHLIKTQTSLLEKQDRYIQGQNRMIENSKTYLQLEQEHQVVIDGMLNASARLQKLCEQTSAFMFNNKLAHTANQMQSAQMNNLSQNAANQATFAQSSAFMMPSTAPDKEPVVSQVKVPVQASGQAAAQMQTSSSSAKGATVPSKVPEDSDSSESESSDEEVDPLDKEINIGQVAKDIGCAEDWIVKYKSYCARQILAAYVGKHKVSPDKRRTERGYRTDINKYTERDRPLVEKTIRKVLKKQTKDKKWIP